jgi:hypothetical protein
MEIPMIIGGLKYNGWEIKSPVPDVFNLGTGHLNFLKARLVYLERRHSEVVKEMHRRGFKKYNSHVILTDAPLKFCKDWKPSIGESMIIRHRIIDRLLYRYNLSKTYWRYEGSVMDMISFYDNINNIRSRELFYV